VSLVLLPDDTSAATEIVRLMRKVDAQSRALKRTREERDYWRQRANRHDPDYQEGLGDHLYHLQQDDCDGR
jgi:hypothetical protein